MQNNNPLTEISTMVLAALLIIAASLLMYFGKIDFTGATLMFGLAAGLYGVNGALKVPSATQQTQINTLQQGLQDLINLFASHTHPAPPTPPAPPAVPVQQPAPLPPTGIGPNPPDTTTNAPIHATYYGIPVTNIPPHLQQTQEEPPPTPQFVPDPGVSMAAYSTSQMPAVKP